MGADIAELGTLGPAHNVGEGAGVYLEQVRDFHFAASLSSFFIKRMAVPASSSEPNRANTLGTLLPGGKVNRYTFPSSYSEPTFRVSLFGKKGSISGALSSLGRLAPEDRKAAGAEINAAKERVANALDQRRILLEEQTLARRLEAELIDVSLPAPAAALESGRIHPSEHRAPAVTADEQPAPDKDGDEIGDARAEAPGQETSPDSENQQENRPAADKEPEDTTEEKLKSRATDQRNARRLAMDQHVRDDAVFALTGGTVQAGNVFLNNTIGLIDAGGHRSAAHSGAVASGPVGDGTLRAVSATFVKPPDYPRILGKLRECSVILLRAEPGWGRTTTALHLLHTADTGDHGRRAGGQLGGGSGEALAVADGEQVCSELVYLVE